MKKPRELTFVSKVLDVDESSLKGTTLEAYVMIDFRDQDGVFWECHKLIRCKLRKEKKVGPVAVPAEGVAQ